MPVLTYHSAVEGHDLVVFDAPEHLSAAEEEEILATAVPAARAGLNTTFARMRLREHQLRAMATPAQQAISWGHYAVLRYQPATLAGGEPCTIYGHIYTRAEFIRRERRAAAALAQMGQLGDSVEPHLARGAAHLDAAHAAGWRYGRWYSRIEPAGEHGEHHVALLAPLTARQFKAARRAGWPGQVPQ